MWDFNYIMYAFSYDTRNIWLFCPAHWLSKTGFQTLYIHVYIYLKTYLYLYLVRCRTQLWFLYNVHNYVKCAFKFMHLIWSVYISVYIILHLMPVILFVGVTEGYFVIHLLLWRTTICTGYSVTLSSSSSSMEFSNI